MALSIGTLVGYLDLDDRKFESGLNGAQAKFSQVGEKIRDNAKRIGVASGAALGAAVTAGVVANIDAGRANDKLAAQLGLGAKQSAEVGKVAANLYRGAWGDSMEDVNNAVGSVMTSIKGMSNASAKDLEAVTVKALDFASAFEVDVERAAQVAGQAVSTGLAKDATEAFDLITAASQKVPSALREDLLDATDEYGQFFAGMGYTGKQAMAMLVDASKDGMYGIDKVGDAVKEFSIRATDMSKSTKDAYRDFGASNKDIQQFTNSLLAGGDTARSATQEIVDGLLSIKDPGRQARASIALFGTPLEDLNVTEIPAFLDSMKGMSGSMDDSAGAADRMGETLNDNFATRAEGWKRQAKGFAQDGLMAIADGFEHGGRKGKGLEGDLSELGATIKSPVLPVVKMLGRFVADNAKAFMILGGIVGAVMVGTKIYRGVVLVTTAAVKAQTIAVKLLNLAMRMNPIGLVITLIAALATGFVLAYKKSETFRRIVNGVWDAVKRGTKTAVLFVADKVLWMAEKMLGAMSTAFSWVPGLGDKMKAAHQAVKGLRVAVNKEMDLMRDEEVKISFAVGRRKSQESSNSGFGPQISGGGGGAPGTGAHAHGGAGLSFATETDAAKRGVSRVAASATAQAAEIAAELAKRERKRMGSLGPSGKVLRPGSYSIGMPYLGYPGHYGADYPAATGTPVYAAASGIVSRALALATSYGKHIFLSHPGGRETRYAHLNSMMVRAGQAVRAGQKIGTVGSTGNSTGPHLHYEDRINGAARNPASLGIFDTGGLARGAGLMVKGPKPERVLSPTQTEWFEKALRNASHGGGRPVEVTINYPASTTPEEAYASSGGRVVAALSALGV